MPLIVVTRTKSMGPRKDVDNARTSDSPGERWIALENRYQIYSSGNWVGDVFPAISAPPVFTLLFVFPGLFDAFIDRLYTYFIADCNWTVPKMGRRGNYQN